MDEETVDQPSLTGEDTKAREARYASAGNSEARVVIERAVADHEGPIDATLLDISLGGAKLVVNSCIWFDESIRLKIHVAELNVDLAIAAAVCWTRPVSEHEWLLGCAFKPKLPEHALDQIASHGYIDRRRYSRFPFDVKATATWELREANVPVALQDASEGGFCMISPQYAETGQRLILHLNAHKGTPVSIPATVQWRINSGDEFLLGCSFNNENDFEHLLAALPTTALAEEGQGRRFPIWSPVGILGTVFAAIVVLLTCWYWVQHITWPSAQIPEEQVALAAEAANTMGGEITLPLDFVEIGGSTEPGNRNQQPTGVEPVGVSSGNTFEGARSKPSAGNLVPSPTSLAPREAAKVGQDRIDDERSPTQDSLPLTHGAVDSSSPVIDVLIEEDDSAEVGGGIMEDDANTERGSVESNPVDRPLEPESKTVEPGESEMLKASATEPEGPRLRSIPPTSDGSDVVFDVDESERESLPAPDDRVTDEAEVLPEQEVRTTVQDPRRATQLAQKASDRYHRGDFAAAADRFQQASDLDATNPFYVYLTALAEYQSGEFDDARRSLIHAAELERSNPIKNWGAIMRRYQGRARVWLEQSRSAAKGAE